MTKKENHVFGFRQSAIKYGACAWKGKGNFGPLLPKHSAFSARSIFLVLCRSPDIPISNHQHLYPGHIIANSNYSGQKQSSTQATYSASFQY
jgi:hypothetical protein